MVWVARSLVACAILFGVSMFLIYLKMSNENEEERQNTVKIIYAYTMGALIVATIGEKFIKILLKFLHNFFV